MTTHEAQVAALRTRLSGMPSPRTGAVPAARPRTQGMVPVNIVGGRPVGNAPQPAHRPAGLPKGFFSMFAWSRITDATLVSLIPAVVAAMHVPDEALWLPGSWGRHICTAIIVGSAALIVADRVEKWVKEARWG